jgi:hypothetical protein
VSAACEALAHSPHQHLSLIATRSLAHSPHTHTPDYSQGCKEAVSAACEALEDKRSHLLAIGLSKYMQAAADAHIAANGCIRECKAMAEEETAVVS